MMQNKTGKLLAVVTSAGEYEKVGFRTGLWLGELTHFLDVVEEAGFQVDIASPQGGYTPIDPESLLPTELKAALGLKGDVHKRYEDRAFMDRLKTTLKLSDIDPSGYDGIYMTGGHGVMFDFPEALARLTAEFHQQGKIVSAVCHGPCGLLEVKTGAGAYLLQGKKVTGFSWTEEKAAKRDLAVPYNLEQRLQERGGIYEKSSIPFKSHVVEDGLLITGQNPASATGVAEAVVHSLKPTHVTA
jgi:putative intracellular protease/amidase